MKTSTLSLLTAFVSAAFVSLVGAQGSKTDLKENPPPDKSSEPADKSKEDDNSVAKEKMPATQEEFLKMAARKGLSEVKCAQIALSKSETAKVRELAAVLVKDHSSANQELKSVAEKLDVVIPAEPDENMKKKHAELEKKFGTDFDTAFLNGMAASHRKGIELFEEGAKIAKAEPVLTFIEKTLPTLRHHANKIKELGGVDEERATIDEKQAVAPAPPKIPDTVIPGPR